MTLDWNVILGGALGGIAFAAFAAAGAWLILKIKSVISRKPMFIVRKDNTGRYTIEKMKRGITRDIRFSTGYRGISTSPPSGQEHFSIPTIFKKGDRYSLDIDPAREVDEIFLVWDTHFEKGGQANFEDDEARIFPNGVSAKAWLQNFK